MGFALSYPQFTSTGFVTSFNGRTGAVTLFSSDVITALGYTPANAALYVPYTGSTASVDLGANNLTASIIHATTGIISDGIVQANAVTYKNGAFGGQIQAATITGNRTYQLPDQSGTLALAGSGVTSFNGRNGAVTLLSADVTAALGFTPENVANKATTLAGANNTTYPTTLAVSNAIAAIGTGVTSFNTRTGAVTLLSADVVAALGYTPANASLYLPLVAGSGNSLTGDLYFADQGRVVLRGTANALVSVQGTSNSVIGSGSNSDYAISVQGVNPWTIYTNSLARFTADGSGNIIFYDPASIFTVALIPPVNPLTSNRFVEFQDKTGRLALLGDLGGFPVNNPGLTASATLQTFVPVDATENYTICAWLNLFSSTATTVLLQVAFTDSRGSAQTKVLIPTGATTGLVGGLASYVTYPQITLQIQVGSNIVISSVVAGTTISYDVGTVVIPQYLA